jgi:hypothetical protein
VLFAAPLLADNLGPNPPTHFVYGALGGTAIDSVVEPTAVGGFRQSWTPFDPVVEVSIRSNPSIALMASKQMGEQRIMGGVSFNEGANPGLVFGADYKRLMIRLNAYDSSQTVASCRHHRCSNSTVTKNHSALFVGYTFQLDAK